MSLNLDINRCYCSDGGRGGYCIRQGGKAHGCSCREDALDVCPHGRTVTDAPDFSIPARLWQPAVFLSGVCIGVLVTGLFLGHKVAVATDMVYAQDRLIQNMRSSLDDRDAALRAGEALLAEQLAARKKGCAE